MVAQIKTFLQSLSEIPEGKFPPSHYTPISRRTIYLGNYLYLAPFVHLFIYALVWSLLQLYVLLLVIFLVDIPVSTAAFILHRKGYFLFAHFLTASKIIILIILYILAIGWEAGFQYWLILPSVTVFYTPWRVSIKISLISSYIITYFALYFYSLNAPSYLNVNPVYLKILYQFNILLFSAYIAFAINIFYKIAIKSDKRIFAAHKKTLKALYERDTPQASHRAHQRSGMEDY